MHNLASSNKHSRGVEGLLDIACRRQVLICGN